MATAWRWQTKEDQQIRQFSFYSDMQLKNYTDKFARALLNVGGSDDHEELQC